MLTLLLSTLALAFLCVICVKSLPVAWFVFIFAVGCSGINLTLAGLTILPEHVALLFVVAHITRQSGGSSNRRVVPVFLLAVTWLTIATSVSALSEYPLPELKLTAWLMASFAAGVVAFKAVSLRPSLARTTSVALVLYCLIAIAGWALTQGSGKSSIFTEIDYASDFPRAQGLMLEPNLLASFVTLGLVTCLCLRETIPSKLIQLQVLLTVTVVAISVTRVGFIVVGFAVAAYLFMEGRRRLGLVLTVAAAVVSIYVFAGNFADGSPYSFSSALSSRGAQGFFSTTSGTGAFRLRAADIAVAEVLHGDWLVGYGTNSFTQSHFSNITSDGHLYLGVFWISLLYDTGVVGALLFGLLIIAIIRAGGRRAAAVVLAFSAFALATNPLWYAYSWVAVGMILSVGPARKRESLPAPTRRLREAPLRASVL